MYVKVLKCISIYLYKSAAAVTKIKSNHDFS